MDWDEKYIREEERGTPAPRPGHAEVLSRGQTGYEPVPEGDAPGAQVIRLRPLRVLVISEDEPFRAVNAMLIARRGCRVFSLTGAYAAAELVARERVDVVLVDGVERLRALIGELAITAGLAPTVGIVFVDEPGVAGFAVGSPKAVEVVEQLSCSGELAGSEATPATAQPALEKWAEFEDLFAAIVRADRARVREPAVDVAWPTAAWARGLD
ncbi:MAG TPA: hypothetical protein VK774_08870 [Solirubrobacteraceae bacterium]|nr:hypothetical protein [Solirubrobacteraceae bacterium]